MINGINGLSSAAGQLPIMPAARAATPAEVTKGFAQFLTDAIDGVDTKEQSVQKVTEQFIIGQADVTDVLIVSEQSKLALQLTTQVRNKVIEAYQEIMRTQI